jgi:hypothetical protein
MEQSFFTRFLIGPTFSFFFFFFFFWFVTGRAEADVTEKESVSLV